MDRKAAGSSIKSAKLELHRIKFNLKKSKDVKLDIERIHELKHVILSNRRQLEIVDKFIYQ
jgi:hypothetical protein